MNIAEEKSLAKKMFSRMLGPEFEVKSKDDELFFRKKGSKKFFRLDPEGFEGGLREVILDTFADLSGEGIEAVASVTGEVVGVAAGAAVAGGPGAIIGAIAGVPIGGGFATLARQAAIEVFEGETSTDLAQEFAMNTGFNLVALGTGVILKSGFKRASVFLKEALEKAPGRRVKQLAEIRQAFEQVANEIGAPIQKLSPPITGKKPKGGFTQITTEIGPKAKTRGQIGKEIEDSITRQNNMLDKKVKLVKSETIAKSVGLDGSPKIFDTNTYAEELASVLDELGVTREVQSAMVSEVTSKIPTNTVRRNVLQGLKNENVLGDASGLEFA
ncbi:MAG: hypothetical protein IIB73_04085, partial [Proteobacteria bacterium]|nr:hypothetical protein [Pseudomonadota bacterium]